MKHTQTLINHVFIKCDIKLDLNITNTYVGIGDHNSQCIEITNFTSNSKTNCRNNLSKEVRNSANRNNVQSYI